MTDMFIPKKEKIILTVEAISYVLLILLASYWTICGNLVIRMVPMIYFLGVFGVILFKKPVVTVILNFVSAVVFGMLVEHEFNLSIFLYCLYSSFMLVCGEITGHILNVLYENYKLRKFIKHYTKITYVIILIVCILVPLFLNNIVNSNFVTYISAKNSVIKYINEHYAYSHCYIDQVSYKYGVYEFKVNIDAVDVLIEYRLNGNIADINVEKRKESLNKVANAEINILLKENNLTNLNVNCIYNYSKIATVPDIIKLTIDDIGRDKLKDIVSLVEIIKRWNKYNLVERIDVAIDGISVSITKKDLQDKNITEEYLLNGMDIEMLDSKEGIKYE